MVQNETPQELEKRMDELARKYASSHGEDIKIELRELSQQIGRDEKTINLSLNGITETEQQVSDP